jgi:hypothetical protein
VSCKPAIYSEKENGFIRNKCARSNQARRLAIFTIEDREQKGILLQPAGYRPEKFCRNLLEPKKDGYSEVNRSKGRG